MNEFQSIPEGELNFSQESAPAPEVSEPEMINNTEESEEERKRQRGLEALVKRGYISYSEDGQIIADIDKIDNYSSKVVAGNSLPEALRRVYGIVSFSSFQDIFRDKPVISRQDWEQGKREPKPLFYDPVSDEAALDPTTIKTSNFYLTPFKANREYEYQRLDQVSEAEANIALLVYHPRFGNGYRDKNGQLMVANTSGTLQPINGGYFAKNFGFYPQGADQKSGSFPGSPVRFLETKGKHLLENGTLNLSDFKQMHLVEEGALIGTDKEVRKDGWVFLDGVDYYLGQGKKLKGEKVRILSSNCAVLIQDEVPTAYFRLRPDLRVEGLAVNKITQKQTNLKEYNETTFSEKWPDETDEEYKARMEGLFDFKVKPVKIGDLSAQTKKQMKEISRHNWSILDNPVLRQKVIEDFNNLLDTDKNSRFFVVGLNEKIISSFVRISPMSDPDRVYVGALNNNPDSDYKAEARSFGVIFAKIAKTHVIENTAYPKLPAIRTYMKEFGCVIKAVEPYPGTDIPMFRMELDRRKKYRFLRDKDVKKALPYFNNNNYSLDDDIIVLKYHQESEYEIMIAEANHILSQQKHVMTSYQNNPGEEGYKYLVFEKKPSPEGEAEV